MPRKTAPPSNKKSALRAARPSLTLFLLLAGFVLTVHAQLAPDPLQFVISPEVPEPNGQVQIQAQGVGSFLGDAAITWQKNGVTVLSGAGQSTYSFTAGGLGSVTRIHVSINSKTQGVITRDFTFLPSLVNLVWEAQTTVPTFYMGKPLYSAGSPLSIIAFPIVVIGGTQVPPGSLSYQWSVGDTPQPGASGLGRLRLSLQGDQLQTGEQASVDVYYQGSRVGHGEITISATDPAVALYEQDPLRGEVLDQALPGGISLSGKELTVRAEPYFFSATSKNAGTLTWSWMLDGQDTTGPYAAQGLLTLRQTGSGAGSAGLSVSLQDTSTDTFVQSAKTTLQLIFGQTSAGVTF